MAYSSYNLFISKVSPADSSYFNSACNCLTASSIISLKNIISLCFVPYSMFMPSLVILKFYMILSFCCLSHLYSAFPNKTIKKTVHCLLFFSSTPIFLILPTISLFTLVCLVFFFTAAYNQYFFISLSAFARKRWVSLSSLWQHCYPYSSHPWKWLLKRAA